MRLPFLLLLLPLTACAQNTRTAGDADSTRADTALQALPLSTPAPTRTATYRCDDVELVAELMGDEARLWLPDTTVAMTRERTASGVRYNAPGMSFWVAGDSARWEVAGADGPCRMGVYEGAWAEARADGAAFRGLGQEPGWTVAVEPDGRIRAVLDYGERTIDVPTPAPSHALGPIGRTYYTTETEAHQLRLVIEARPCRDGMSGRPFETGVTLTVDGTTYRGCGRWLTD